MSGPAPLPLPEPWRELVEAFIRAETAAGRSPATIRKRRSDLGRLARSVGGDPRGVTEARLEAWLERNRHWAIETRRSHRNTTVMFFRWAHRKGHIPTDPAAELPVVRPATAVPRPAPDAAWRHAIQVADPRTRLMLRLAGEVGLRRAEVAQVHTRDLTTGAGGPQLLVHGKGGKLRMVPLADDLAELIAQGAPGHSPEMAAYGVEGYLFPGDDNGHLSPVWVGKMVAAVLPGIWTMHTLRHRFATRAYRGTGNLRAVQTLLGHSSVATTERYTAVDHDEVRAAMMAALD
ncbi:tyrosine-type recombinase/integrase [Mycolicibacterium goodii]|uniref:tyrosine-type recombinase/integrase n=1 Tax=Mycolicibacterium goodii TaxID=134601 RepID=UPI001BDC8FCD|nr:tyrosine-type recombinase/integrase [Mycolicibacterium goodii]MBU8831152.1 tyrosine-type recombinase/integrase [Mycolicibacterium goodii]